MCLYDLKIKHLNLLHDLHTNKFNYLTEVFVALNTIDDLLTTAYLLIKNQASNDLINVINATKSALINYAAIKFIHEFKLLNTLVKHNEFAFIPCIDVFFISFKLQTQYDITDLNDLFTNKLHKVKYNNCVINFNKNKLNLIQKDFNAYLIHPANYTVYLIYIGALNITNLNVLNIINLCSSYNEINIS